jgi:Omp85 superfamily domain
VSPPRGLWFTAALLSLLAGAVARAEDNYETRFVDEVVKQTGRARATELAGRTVEDVQVVTEEIFTKEDLWPTFLNIFHRVTRERIVRQEVLLAPGKPWDDALAKETERNLRRLFIFAVVAVVPLEGDHGGVVLLVVTKDRWSLRLNSEFNLVGSLLQYLRLRPTEENFLGNNQQLAVDFILRLDTITLGEFFQDRKLFGTKLYFGEIANVIFNRQTFAPEGTSGNVIFGLPLTSLDQTWGFTLQGEWLVRRRRVFRGPNILGLEYPDPSGSTTTIPWVWDVREGSAEASLALRLGQSWKLDLQGTLGFFTRQFTAPKETGLTDDQAAWLVSNWLPRSEYATFLYVEGNLYPRQYEVLRNIDTFELSEDFLLGPLFKLAARWGLPRPLSSDHFLELGATARYRAHFGGNLLTVSAGGQVRFQQGKEPVNEQLAVEFLNYSPPFWGGRFVTRFVAQWRWNDLDNGRSQLGGGNGLRGAAPEQYLGRHFFLSNIEYRTNAFELKTVFVGFVLFWDAGSAWDQKPVVTHTLGMGIRILLPQFNADTIRIDFGVVLGGPPPSADRIAASYGQITDLRPAQLSEPLTR